MYVLLNWQQEFLLIPTVLLFSFFYSYETDFMYEKKLAQFVDLTFPYIELNNSKNGNFVIDRIYPIGREINACRNHNFIISHIHDLSPGLFDGV